MLVLKGLVGLHRTVQLQLLQRDIEWFVLEMNRDHSVIFEITSKYCISDAFVDHDGYSISSKGFLSTDILNKIEHLMCWNILTRLETFAS